MFLKLEFNFEKHLVRLFLSFFLFFFLRGGLKLGLGVLVLCVEKKTREPGEKTSEVRTRRNLNRDTTSGDRTRATAIGGERPHS